jgi:hypothetical protein
VRARGVVVLAPLRDDDGGLLGALEDFAIEAFVPPLAVEGLAIAVLPRTAGFNIKRLGFQPCEPVTHDPDRHLRAFSDRMCSGTPRSSITSAIVSMTPKLLRQRATLIARHCRSPHNSPKSSFSELEAVGLGFASQPCRQLRPAPPARDVAHRDSHSFLLADQNDKPLAAGDAGIEKITLQHGVVLRYDRDHYGG